MQNLFEAALLQFVQQQFPGWQSTPHQQGDNLFATDSFAMIKTPVVPLTGAVWHSIPKQPKPKDGPPDFMQMFYKVKTFKSPRLFETDWVRRALAKIEQVPARVICIMCGGEGQVECNYGHIHDCDFCGNEGYVAAAAKKGVDQPLTYPDNGWAIDIDGQYYAPHQLAKLLFVLDLFGQTKFAAIGEFNINRNQKQGTGLEFIVHDCDILICPLLNNLHELVEYSNDRLMVVDLYTRQIKEITPEDLP